MAALHFLLAHEFLGCVVEEEDGTGIGFAFFEVESGEHGAHTQIYHVYLAVGLYFRKLEVQRF